MFLSCDEKMMKQKVNVFALGFWKSYSGVWKAACRNRRLFFECRNKKALLTLCTSIVMFTLRDLDVRLLLQDIPCPVISSMELFLKALIFFYKMSPSIITAIISNMETGKIGFYSKFIWTFFSLSPWIFESGNVIQRLAIFLPELLCPKSLVLVSSCLCSPHGACFWALLSSKSLPRALRPCSLCLSLSWSLLWSPSPPFNLG